MHQVSDDAVAVVPLPIEIMVADVITKYLLENSLAFKELTDIRNKGWQTVEGDRFFQDRWNKLQNITQKQARDLYHMTCQIGEEMDKETSVINSAAPCPGLPLKVLDIGMAPGGFTATVLHKHPTAQIRGITLPQKIGGLEVMIPRWKQNAGIRIEFTDVTMLADEMGQSAKSIPDTHPDFEKFSSKRPFKDEEFDLIFCGAAVQRAQPRAEYRQSGERQRLTMSQIVIALERLRDDGSLVLLLHKAESPDTINILRTFSQFSSVSLVKPKKKHAVRSSFYVVAKNVRSRSKEAQSAIHEWKMQWEKATLHLDSTSSVFPFHSKGEVHDMLTDFGSRLIEIATPVWKTQAQALENSSFMKEVKERKDSVTEH